MNDSAHSPTVRKSAIVSGLVSGVVAIFMILVFGLAGGQRANQPAASSQALTASQQTTSSSPVVDVVADAKPSVVSIIVSRDVPRIEQYFQRGPFGVRIPQRELEGFSRQQVGSGSGFFVSEDGLIVTNRHVVSDAEASYSAVTNDGDTYELEVVGRDPFLDIAVLRVVGSDATFPPLQLGNSDSLQPGQRVIAIGNALGEFQNSVSVGVISGLSRSVIAGGGLIGDVERLDQVIQTDAAINPGNSGGPLLNLDGAVIGVNVAIAQGSENISFALPSNLVKEVVSSVEQHGEIVRPFLGVRYVPITESLAEARDLPTSQGALVVSGRGQPPVTPGSAADQAGIQQGDIITSFDGQDLTEDANLGTIIRNYSVGDTVTITLLRDGERMEVAVTLQRAPEEVQ